MDATNTVNRTSQSRLRIVGTFLGIIAVKCIALTYYPNSESHMELSNSDPKIAMIASHVNRLEALVALEESEKEIIDKVLVNFKEPSERSIVSSLFSNENTKSRSLTPICSNAPLYSHVLAVLAEMKQRTQAENTSLILKLHDLQQLATKAKADWTGDQIEYSHDHEEYDVHRNALKYSLLRLRYPRQLV